MEEKIISCIINFALSILANNVPTIKERNNKLQTQIEQCYKNALEKWPNDAVNEKHSRKAMLNLDLFKDYINGDVSNLDDELKILVARWVEEMHNTIPGQLFINEIKIDAIGDNIKGYQAIVDEIKREVESFGETVQEINSKQDIIISQAIKNEERIEEGKKQILDRIDEKEQLRSRREDTDSLILLNEYFEGDKLIDIQDIAIGIEKIIGEGLWEDEDSERKIAVNLPKRGMMIVKGHEGRGKTILCLKSAYQLYKDCYDVYITQKSWTWNDIGRQVVQIVKSVGKSVIIMEDIHKLSTDSNKVINFINIIRERHKNCLFLINHRPSLEGELDLLLNTIEKEDKEIVVDLTPKETQERRAREFKDYLIEINKLDGKELKVNGKPLDNVIPTNLRALSIYFNYYTEIKVLNGKYNATTNRILIQFADRYGLTGKKHADPGMEAFKLLCALGYYDAPVDSNFLNEDEINKLEEYTSNGLCSYNSGRYYISHSTDAEFLCSSFAKRNRNRIPRDKFIADEIKEYYDRIVEKNDIREEFLKDIENDFVRLVLMRLYNNESNEFKELNEYFRKPEIANHIVVKLCPSYIVKSLYHGESEQQQDRLKIYTDNIQLLKEHITSLPPITIRLLWLTLQHYYNYNNCISDLFGNNDDELLENYIYYYKNDFYGPGFSTLRVAISQYGDNKRIIDKHRISKPQSSRKEGSSLSRIERYLFLQSMQKNKRSVIGLTQIDAKMQMVKESIINNNYLFSPTHLSKIFHHIGSIDIEIYQKYVKDDFFQDIIKSSIEKRLFSIRYLYLYGHFYQQNEEIKNAIDGMLSSSIDKERKVLNEWVTKLHNKKNRRFEEGSLAYTVEQVLREETSV